MNRIVRHVAVYAAVLVLLALFFRAIEVGTDRDFIPSYLALFGFAFFLFAKTHILVNILAKKLDAPVGQLYLGFSVYKIIFTFFYFFFLKVKTPYYTKPFLGVFMIAYFTILVVEFIQYKNLLQSEDSF